MMTYGGGGGEDIYEAVHRKEYELKQVKSVHLKSTTDPVAVAMSYAEQTDNPRMRVARALRRVYDDPHNPANPNTSAKSPEQLKRDEKLAKIGMAEVGMRRASVVIDVKRKSPSFSKQQSICRFDDAGTVAEAMVRLGADAVMIGTDYGWYGGDVEELKSTVRLVRRASPNAAVIMKDLVVDEIQLGLAKEAGADGVLLMACVLGPALSNFLDLCTAIGLEAVVECHTRHEVEEALRLAATNILVNNYDRIHRRYYPHQAIRLAGLFPGSGGPVICLATGGLDDAEQIRRHLAVGYDGVVVGRSCMGSTRAPEIIRAVRDRTLLPAEMSSWGIDADFDVDGNLVLENEGTGGDSSGNTSRPNNDRRHHDRRGEGDDDASDAYQ
jgi:indole-3-glycerol phosphate synthase